MIYKGGKLVEENYIALIYSILKGTSPEQSFKAIHGRGYATRLSTPYNDKDFEDMFFLYLQGVQQRQIVEYYNTSKFLVCRHIKEYRQTHTKEDIERELGRRMEINKHCPVVKDTTRNRRREVLW